MFHHKGSQSSDQNTTRSSPQDTNIKNMTAMKLCLKAVFLLMTTATFCACADSSLEDDNGTPANFGRGFSTNNFQEWNDWYRKRAGFAKAPWDNNQFSGDKFQQWQDWVYKRGFGLPTSGTFGQLSKPEYQGWRDWMSKRGFGIGAPFPGSSDSHTSPFQQWGDWVSKRGWDTPVNGFGGGSGNVGFQSWSDFTKRRDFVLPSANFGKGNFQKWQNWVKRQMSSANPAASAGNSFNGNDHMVNWEDMFTKDTDKRQLGNSPDRFGLQRYFSDGLQDWRSAFKGAKRDKNDVDEQKLAEQ